jgi:hypothetical protein
MAHIDRKILQVHIDEGLITEVKHPVSDLYIYNYTPKTQYAKMWNEVTLMCRGLIANSDGKVIAQPFPKFFNYEEFKGQLPSGNYRISEKMDGSLGITYPNKGTVNIATRGSFTSEQAKVGDEMLQEYIKENGLDWYDEQYTYLFEIIYPQNRIVVNYGDARRLVLLGVINTNTGMERNPHETGYKDVAKELPPNTPIEDLRLTEAPNEEGFVLHWGNGLRLKIKFAEYVRLHRLLTQVSSKSIWELLANGQDIAEVLDNVPDEFYDWVRSVENKLKQGHSGIVVNATQAYEVVKDMPTRKEVAAKLVEYEPVVRAVVFAMLDGKEYDHIIWKNLKPKYEQPFKTEVE